MQPLSWQTGDRYFLDIDWRGIWYFIPESQRENWSCWRGIQFNDPPWYAKRIVAGMTFAQPAVPEIDGNLMHRISGSVLS